MAQSLFKVVQPGLLTLLIGLPEPGLQCYGVPPGGAMDLVSLRLANLLAHNPAHAAALEITLLGPTLEALTDTLLAVAGCEMMLLINGKEAGAGRAVRVAAGDIVSFGPRRAGARAYLAAAGGIVLADSHSAIHTPPSPQRLAKNDVLTRASEPKFLDHPVLSLPPSEQPIFTNPARLRVLPGPQWERISVEGKEAFLGEEYTVSHESSRAGIRLNGEPIVFSEGFGADILSEATPLGTVQVTPSGQPIILMADRPTTGGYAKIATVISADIAYAGQLAPGDRVVFSLTTLQEAQEAAGEMEKKLWLLEHMATWG